MNPNSKSYNWCIRSHFTGQDMFQWQGNIRYEGVLKPIKGLNYRIIEKYCSTVTRKGAVYVVLEGYAATKYRLAFKRNENDSEICRAMAAFK